MPLPNPLPDSPTRWEGWRSYNSENPYERLCLDYEANPSNEQIEDNCRQLLVWWQKKLPLKNQPSNPAAQLLRNGIDDAPRYLAEARNVLLNPEARKAADEKLRAQLRETAAAEFHKFLAFSLSDGVLKPEDESNLYHVGSAAGLLQEEMIEMVEAELLRRGAFRYVAPAPVEVQVPVATPGVDFAPNPAATSPPKVAPGAASSDPKTEFARLIRLSGLTEEDMTDDQRDALCNMGENLGLTGGEAEDLIDDYFEEITAISMAPSIQKKAAASSTASPTVNKSSPPVNKPPTRVLEPTPPERFTPLHRDVERQKHPPFTTGTGLDMLFIPSGTFIMGSTADGAAPNEQPLCKTNISCFYIARHPITNAQYEMFDSSHIAKRGGWANGSHPVIYVSSIDAIKFCEWLSRMEGRKFRLPTEAEWEYAARGTDGRSFPWGEKLNRGDLANFADCNTTFPWREPEINDGFAETSPVGNYPRGASPFGVEDMAGNVWEWCLDYFEPYKGKERTNPRSNSSTGRRIYRGGSWKSRAASLRTSARNFNVPEYCTNDVGFRVVCEC
jgi:formylglycine-generating enzyme required for sulfatase activity